MKQKYYYLTVFLNATMIMLFMFAIIYSIGSIITYVAHLLKDGYLNLLIVNLILYIPPFIILYIKKRLRKKLLNQSN